MDYGLWIMDYGLWIMGYGLWVMGYGLWVMVYGYGPTPNHQPLPLTSGCKSPISLSLELREPQEYLWSKILTQNMHVSR
jgi:hypothetical protein